MLSQAHRINTQNFKSIYNSGKKVFTSFFKGSTKSAPLFMCSVVVSKKIFTKAHIRNKEKRRIIALVQDIVPLQAEFSCIIIVSKDTRVLGYNELKNELEIFLRKAGIVK